MIKKYDWRNLRFNRLCQDRRALLPRLEEVLCWLLAPTFAKSSRIQKERPPVPQRRRWAQERTESGRV